MFSFFDFVLLSICLPYCVLLLGLPLFIVVSPHSRSCLCLHDSFCFFISFILNEFVERAATTVTINSLRNSSLLLGIPCDCSSIIFVCAWVSNYIQQNSHCLSVWVTRPLYAENKLNEYRLYLFWVLIWVKWSDVYNRLFYNQMGHPLSHISFVKRTILLHSITVFDKPYHTRKVWSRENYYIALKFCSRLGSSVRTNLNTYIRHSRCPEISR